MRRVIVGVSVFVESHLFLSFRSGETYFLILFITDIPAISEKRTQAFVSLSVGVIFICIGLPLWWNTTKVYRAALPYHEIEQLNQLKVSCINRKSSNAGEWKGGGKLECLKSLQEGVILTNVLVDCFKKNVNSTSSTCLILDKHLWKRNNFMFGQILV